MQHRKLLHHLHDLQDAHLASEPGILSKRIDRRALKRLVDDARLQLHLSSCPLTQWHLRQSLHLDVSGGSSLRKKRKLQ